MINKKPLITTTLAIFITIYIITLVLAIIDNKPLNTLLYGFLETWGLIIGCSGIGFFGILALITFNRKKVTDQLYDSKSNGRFSVEKGELFCGKSYHTEELTPETDLPDFILNWLNQKDKDDLYRKVFLILCSILKAHRNIYVNKLSIYAYNCNIIRIMLEEESDLNPDVIIIIGLVHNLGKIEITDDDAYLKIADKSKCILANIDAAWKLTEIRQLLFITGNYPNNTKTIDQKLSECNLVSESVVPYIKLIKQTYKLLDINFSNTIKPAMNLADYENKVADIDSEGILDNSPIIANEAPEKPKIYKPVEQTKTPKVNKEPTQKKVSKLDNEAPTTIKSKQEKIKPDLGIKLNELKI
jgi:hypothetical protein